MTRIERFNKWGKRSFWGYSHLEPKQPAIECFEAGYAQGIADAKAMRGRCKQCAQKIEEGTEPLTGVVKELHERLKWKEQRFQDQEKMLRMVREDRDAARKALRLAEESLKIYRQNLPSANVTARWTFGRTAFVGTALEAIEYFSRSGSHDYECCDPARVEPISDASSGG